jgi:hypothetical protein
MSNDFTVKVSEDEDSNVTTFECLYGGVMQGTLEYNKSHNTLSMGVRDYILSKSGAMTLRDAVPETELSHYNIANLLIKELQNKFNKFSNITPNYFGHKSYTQLVLEEQNVEGIRTYKDMSKDELIDIILKLESRIDTYEMYL